MTLLQVIYSLAGGFGLVLGSMFMLLWAHNRKERVWFLAATMSFAAGITALLEISAQKATETDTMQLAFNLLNLSIGIMLISMTWFVRLRLGTGRVWVAVCITLMWAFGLAVNQFAPGNLTFASIAEIGFAETPWGEFYTFPVAPVLNPFKIVADLATLVIILFVIDASWSAYRKGNTHEAMRTGGSVLFFILAAGIHTPLVDAGIVQTPSMISIAFVAICVALAMGLIDGVGRSASLNRELEMQQRRWQSLLEVIELAAVRIDNHGQLAYINPFFEKMSGYSLADIRGKDPLMLIDDQSEKKRVETLLKEDNWSVRSGTQTAVRTASGERREVIWFSVTLRDQDGNPDGFISFGQDITDQIHARNDLEKTRSDLERLARATMLGELASTLAHELNQPVAAVLGNAQALQITRKKAGVVPDEVDEILADIVHDIRRAGSLMNQVRSFMFNAPTTSETFDLIAAIRECITLTQAGATTGSPEIRLDCDKVEIIYQASRLQIQQVILNLILNAIQSLDHAGRANGQIVISVWQDDSGDIQTLVEDDGPGLDVSLEDNLFQPFVSSKTDGNGIGLAVSKRIVERHGGVIKAEASELGGARFSVRLPQEIPELGKRFG